MLFNFSVLPLLALLIGAAVAAPQGLEVINLSDSQYPLLEAYAYERSESQATEALANRAGSAVTVDTRVADGAVVRRLASPPSILQPLLISRSGRRRL
jgi:hypothetical protein